MTNIMELNGNRVQRYRPKAAQKNARWRNQHLPDEPVILGIERFCSGRTGCFSGKSRNGSKSSQSKLWSDFGCILDYQCNGLNRVCTRTVYVIKMAQYICFFLVNRFFQFFFVNSFKLVFFFIHLKQRAS